MISITCRKCGDVFEVFPSRQNTSFCSRRCADASKNIDPEKRFWTKVEKGEDCWIWTGAVVNGYGVFPFSAKSLLRAHRYSYLLVHGSIPVGMFILHRCDNPVCVRPEHLFVGTHQDNMRDMTQKGRQARGERHFSKVHSERLARGTKNGAYTHPEKRVRGDLHHTRQHPEQVMRGELNGRAILSEVDVVQIREACSRGETFASLAAHYGVAKNTIKKVVSKENWKHVQ